MNRKILTMILCLLCFTHLTACSAQPEKSPADDPPKISDSISTPVPTDKDYVEKMPTPSPEQPADTPITNAEISSRLTAAIIALEPTVTLDVSGRDWSMGAELDLKNIYYSILSDQPDLKYAYDMLVTVTGETAECLFSYMPYKTGIYTDAVPAGSHIIGSLHDADVIAQSMIDGTESLMVAITDATLEVDELNQALAQAGYGWMMFTLSSDGTEIKATPANNMTIDECIEVINESFRLSGEILAKIITEEMTELKKVETIYSYITENVAYDFRYYNTPAEMPFESTVAIGALRDNLAICGGYSHALETLLDMCGIENYTVFGISHGEYHMWNYVVLDGVGYYCDPTADRGGMDNHFLLTESELNTLGGYVWDNDFYPAISR